MKQRPSAGRWALERRGIISEGYNERRWLSLRKSVHINRHHNTQDQGSGFTVHTATFSTTESMLCPRSINREKRKDTSPKEETTKRGLPKEEEEILEREREREGQGTRGSFQGGIKWESELLDFPQTETISIGYLHNTDPGTFTMPSLNHSAPEPLFNSLHTCSHT